MANIFAIDAATKNVIRDVLDDFLADEADGGLGKKCRLIYPPKTARCGNCVFDATTNRSSNRPKSGAPVPFAPGSTCPMCGGKALIEEEVSEDIVLKCSWEFKKFLNPPGDLKLRLPYSLVEVKGFMRDVPKIQKAVRLVVNLPIQPYLRQEYVLLGEPGDPSNIIQGRYFFAVFERVS